MWSRLDDALLDHQKIADAGELLGKNGKAIALALYVVGLMYANKHLTDGYLSEAVVKGFPHFENPLVVADALIQVGLWERNGRGYGIHDFHDFNPSAKAVLKRRKDRHADRS
jgi:hypothetical protein